MRLTRSLASVTLLGSVLLTSACSSSPEPSGTPAASAGSNAAGSSGAASAGSSGAGGPSGGGGQGGVAGAGGGGGAGSGGSSGSSGGGGLAGQAGSGPSMVPADYQGTPFKTLQIPGTVHAADYDRGGAGIAYCHGNESDCQAGVVAGDWAPQGTPVYRPAMPADTPICGGAACDDNIGLCHMNAGKPDNYMTSGELVMPQDIYICYVATGEWLKYTVEVSEAGTYSIGGQLAAPAGVTLRLDFGGEITTGTFAIPESSTATCACTESYHSWQTLDDLATVTFPSAGTYLMTLTVVTQQFNADTLVFTKI